MLAQSEGNYAEALQNYYEAMRLKLVPYSVIMNYVLTECLNQTINLGVTFEC
jgi:hypothetical protein